MHIFSLDEKGTPYLYGFVKADLPITSLFFFWFKLNLNVYGHLGLMHDNAKCVLADHIDPIVRDSPAQHYLQSLKGSNRRLNSIWISQSLWFIVPPENVSFLWRRHYYRWRASNFDLCSAFIVIEHWGLTFFSVPNLLWYLLSVYNGHLQEPVFNQRDMGLYRFVMKGDGVCFI